MSLRDMGAIRESTRPKNWSTDNVGPLASFRFPIHLRLLLILIVVGLACRIYDLGRLPLWSDEAESSINALTILERGVPADTYQGHPIYENWMVKPWPGNSEFEFRDISYNDRGVAVYHAWLPLYSIALSFRLLGITPARAGAMRPQYSAAERQRRTIAARLPSVLFGMLCILGFYLAGSRLQSRGTGLIAAFLATFLALHISYSQTARYYAATTMLITFCIWAILAMTQSGRWRDFLIGSFLFSLLFYTHLLAFAVACLMWAVAMATRLNQWRTIGPKVVVFASCIAGLCAPWLLGTNFLRYSAGVPRAWRLLSLPSELILSRKLLSAGIVLIGGAALASAATVFKGRVPARFEAAFEPYKLSFVFVYLWTILGYFVFFFSIPAPSLAVNRVLLVVGPATLLIIAMVLRSIAAAVCRKNVLLFTGIGATAFLSIFNSRHSYDVRLATPLEFLKPADVVERNHHVDAAVEYLRTAPVEASTKLFASPDMQLVLTFYTGMFIQSIVPVRKSYLDGYPGDIIFFSTVPFWRMGPLTSDLLRTAARNVGSDLSVRDSLELSCRLSSQDFRSEEGAKVARVVPPVTPVPPFAAGLWKQQQEEFPEWFRNNYMWFPSQFPLFREFKATNASDWWFQYYYALVNPEQRRSHPNYENRIHNATLTVLPCADLVVYYSPGHSGLRLTL
ncbi:MAG: glycosyltransferase family 39 protein [Bryobacterales bacterium]|nr:glycosyltransferase family 39 protein [Bryobacterales bacterium]